MPHMVANKAHASAVRVLLFTAGRGPVVLYGFEITGKQ
jgi:hypothetical protein